MICFLDRLSDLFEDLVDQLIHCFLIKTIAIDEVHESSPISEDALFFVEFVLQQFS